MHRGYSNLQSSVLTGIGLQRTARALTAVAVSLVVSGCVATTLTSPVGTPSPALFSNLTLAPQNPNAVQAADGTSSTVDQTSTTVAANGITVPARRPGSDVPAQPQLALANTGSASTAAQKAEKVALTSGGSKSAPKTAEAIQKTNADSKPIAKAKIATIAPLKKKASTSFFASLFQNNQIKRPERGVSNTARSKSSAKNNRKVAIFRPVSKGVLPGVRKLGLFGIYDAREGANEGYSDTRLASIGGLARTSPNGLRIQHSGVQVACLQPGLVRIIKQVQRRYGRVPVVTSGYRSSSSNRRAGGARNSMHIYCKAADIQVAGVSKWALAKYLRTLPGRGGVGTYCHTKSVHIDTGSKRDWNWRCRRGKRSKKRRSRRKRSG